MIFIIQKALKNIRRKLSLQTIYKVLLITVFLVILASYLFYLFESATRPEISFFDSLWWGFVTVTTVGYGDLAPITISGKIVATFLMIIGIGAFGLITATVASSFINRLFKGENGKMKVKLKNHIVIFGYNSKVKSIVEEIKKDNDQYDILLITNKEGMKKPDLDVFYVNGDETDEKTLMMGNVTYASKAIILADESLNSLQMMDAKSVLISLAVKNLSKDIHIFSEVCDIKNSNHFKQAGVDDILISSQISSKIIARSLLYTHVADTIKELTTNAYGNEIYEKKISSLTQAVSFSELVNLYLNEHGCIVIGIVKDGQTMLNPPLQTIVTNDDSIIYISQKAM